MSGGPKKATDTINTFGIAIIGVVATLVTWALVVLLQAFYGHSETTFAESRETDGQDVQQRSMKAQQDAELRGGERSAKTGIGTIDIDRAMKVVTEEAKRAAPSLVPAIGSHDRATVPAVWGRPEDGPPPANAPTDAPDQPDDQTPAGDAPAAPADGAPTDGAPADPSGTAPVPANNAPVPAKPAVGNDGAGGVNR